MCFYGFKYWYFINFQYVLCGDDEGYKVFICDEFLVWVLLFGVVMYVVIVMIFDCNSVVIFCGFIQVCNVLVNLGKKYNKVILEFVCQQVLDKKLVFMMVVIKCIQIDIVYV